MIQHQKVVNMKKTLIARGVLKMVCSKYLKH